MALREQVVGLGAAAAPVSDVVLSLGPHHPSTHGVLQLALVLDGPVAAVYVLANVALGVHLAHGVWSATQTLGIDSPAWERWRRGTALGVAGAITAGNVSMPVAVLAGWVT